MVPTKTDQRRLERSKVFWVQLHLLEWHHVLYVCWVFVVYPNSSSIVPFDGQHDNEGVIMWLSDSPCISFRKDKIFISWEMIFGYWVLYMNTVDLSLNCFSKRPVWRPYYWSFSDRLYFSHDLFRIVSLIFFFIVNRFLFRSVAGLVVFLDKFLELSSLD